MKNIPWRCSDLFFLTGNIKGNCCSAHSGLSRVSVPGALRAVTGANETVGPVALHRGQFRRVAALPAPTLLSPAPQVWWDPVKQCTLPCPLLSPPYPHESHTNMVPRNQICLNSPGFPRRCLNMPKKAALSEGCRRYTPQKQRPSSPSSIPVVPDSARRQTSTGTQSSLESDGKAKQRSCDLFPSKSTAWLETRRPRTRVGCGKHM